MAGQRATAMVTDPPYLVDYAGGSHPASKSNQGAANKDKDWSTSYREVDIKDAEHFLLTFLELGSKVALVDDAPWYVWHASARQGLLQRCWEAVGGLVHQQIIWVKSRPILTYSHFMWQHEPCLYGWKKGHQPTRRPPPNERSVWEIESAGNDDGIHPTQKPVALFARPIEWHVHAGEVVYEPFGGSGTCLIAAHSLKRRCFGMELSPIFADVICRRFQEFTGTTPILESTGEAWDFTSEPPARAA